MTPRYLAKVNKSGPVSAHRPDLGACWIWLGHIIQNGYGQFRDGAKIKLAHRVSYEMSVGPIPDGMELDHLCRNRACVNPAHLEAKTGRANRRAAGARTNVLKTHCPNGHAYTPENTYLYRAARYCRECKRVRDRKRYQKGVE